MFIGTWNILSLKWTRSFRNLKHELKMYKIRIAFLPEILWKETVTMDTGNCTFFYSGNRNNTLAQDSESTQITSLSVFEPINK
jgi:hypothetical protein